MAPFSDDIICEILSWLPIKDLVRFRCVSKVWYNLIADPRFIRLQSERSILNPTLIFLDSDNDLFCLRHQFHRKRLDLRIGEWPISVNQILGSCGGLLSILDEPDTVFLLNPSSKKLNKLPLFPFATRSHAWGFGFCSITQRYKLVTISTTTYHMPGYPESEDVFVHTVGSDSWRKIGTVTRKRYSSSQTLVKGAPHWQVENPKNHSSKIVSFDFANEEFHEIDYPEKRCEVYSEDFLGEMDGCLCLLRALCQNGVLEVWVMEEEEEEDGVKESWNKKFCFEDLIVNGRVRVGDFKFLGFLRSFEIVGVCDRGKVGVFNVENQTVRYLANESGFGRILHFESLHQYYCTLKALLQL